MSIEKRLREYIVCLEEAEERYLNLKYKQPNNEEFYSGMAQGVGACINDIKRTVLLEELEELEEDE